MTQKALLPAVLAFVAAVLPLAASAEEATSSIDISAQDGAIEWKVKNRSYDVVSFWPAGAEGPRTLLLAENVTLTRRTDMDGSQNPKVRVVASDIGADGALTPAWEIETVAEEDGTH